MKISIIIPCYNVEDYISPLLGSILKQIEGKDVEVICVNDGSTDRTLSILKSFSSKNSSLHIINQENSGTASARNSGLNIAKGEYIWFVDGDDSIDKSAIDTLIHEIEVNSTDVICFNYNRVDVNGNIVSCDYNYDYLHIYKGTEAYARFNIPSYLWNRIIRRCLIEKNRIRFDFLPEDEDFLINLYLVAKTFRFINCCIYSYNDVDGSFCKCVDNHYKYYYGYFLIMKKYRLYTETETNKRFWKKFVWSCLKNIILNYNRVIIGNYNGVIDNRITMYKKIRKHLRMFKNSIPYKGIMALFIHSIKYFPFIIDFPCYFYYKVRIKHV